MKQTNNYIFNTLCILFYWEEFIIVGYRVRVHSSTSCEKRCINFINEYQLIMVNILLKCVNHFQNHLKITILNENKKMIHFVPRLRNKTFDMLERLVF